VSFAFLLNVNSGSINFWIEIHQDDLMAGCKLAVNGENNPNQRTRSMRITGVTPHPVFPRFIFTEDGRQGVFDVTQYFKYPVFQEREDLTECKKISNGGYCIVWECGAEVSADSIDAALR
jgi:hypothetical protein